MQPQDPSAIQRRTLDVEDYIDIVRRHKTWIFGPTFAGLVAAVVVAFLWSDTYVSSAVIRVVPPQVPESLVPTNLNMDAQGHINAMAQVILSRATLTNIINTQGLYPKERTRMPIDDVVERMKSKDVKIEPTSSNSVTGHDAVSAFRISFAYENRVTAHRVCEDLVSRFITENMKDRSQQSLSTTQFLGDEWEESKKKLDEYEQKLSAFRARNMGRLPDQMESNVQQLNALQIQLTNLDTAISRASQDKLLLENQIRIYKDQIAVLKEPVLPEQVIARRSEKLAEKDREVANLENNLTVLREKYKDTYPDVQRVEGLLATARKQREALLKEEEDVKPAAAGRAQTPHSTREERDIEGLMQRDQAQIAVRNLEIEEYQKELKRVNADMKVYQARIEGLPVGMKEYSELLRDRDLAKKTYEDLDAKMSRSQMSTNLENRKQGATLELLDAASLPQSPSEPKRPVIIAIGTMAAFALGLLLAGAREVKDTSLKNLKDVRAYTQLTVLGSIPLLENDLVVRHRRRLAWLGWSVAGLVGVVVMSGSVAYYFAART